MRRHATDMVSLVFGIIFLIIAGWWLMTRYVQITIPNLGWVAAAALIAIGALGIVGSLRGDRSAKPVEPAPEATKEPEPTKDPDTEESEALAP
jgi:hypothetical protein